MERRGRANLEDMMGGCGLERPRRARGEVAVSPHKNPNKQEGFRRFREHEDLVTKSEAGFDLVTFPLFGSGLTQRGLVLSYVFLVKI